MIEFESEETATDTPRHNSWVNYKASTRKVQSSTIITPTGQSLAGSQVESMLVLFPTYGRVCAAYLLKSRPNRTSKQSPLIVDQQFS